MAFVELAESGRRFSAHRETILDAALAASIPWPHQCRAGECGQCRCRLLSGDVASDPYLPGTLTAMDVSEGMILACRARPRSDVVIALERSMPLPAEMVDGTVVETVRIADRVTRLDVELPKEIGFRPGQYAEVGIDGLPHRCYSMANAPGTPRLEFFVKEVRDGQVSHKLAQCLKGDRLQLRLPLGSAHFQDDGREIVLVGSGTGLGPLLSIWRALQQRADRPEVRLVGVGALWAHELFAGLQDQCWLSNDDLVHTLATEWFQKISWPAVNCHFAGSPRVWKIVQPALAGAGIPSEQIFADPFWSAEMSNQAENPNLVRRLLGRLFSN